MADKSFKSKVVGTLVNVPDSDARERYNRTVTVAGDRVIIKDYKKYSNRLKDGFEVTHKLGKQTREPRKEQDINDKVRRFRSDNVNRSRETLVLTAMENADIIKSFITLTWADDTRTISECMADFDKWKKKLKYHYDFKFEGITIKDTNDRKVIHLHLLSNMKVDTELIPKREVKKTYNKNKDKWEYMEYYDLPYWEHGFSNAKKIEDNYEDKLKSAIYTAKYSVKELNIMLLDVKVWTATQGLKRPKTYYIDTKYDYLDYDFLENKYLWDVKKVNPVRKHGKEFTESIFSPLQPNNNKK